MRSATLLLLLLMSHAQAKDAERPKVTAYFDRVDDGPAFFVECRNTTGKTLSSSAADWPGIWPGTVRVDGVVPPEENILGPGLSEDVAPGQSWSGIIALRQSSSGYGPSVKFDALKRTSLTYPLKAGRHVIAFQCLGTWSSDFSFYWDDERARSNERK
jgi:hypothetical protein